MKHLHKSIYRTLLVFYTVSVLVVSVVPLSSPSASLNSITLLSLRLDYLLHALVFIPLIPLWKLTWPKHRLWLILPAGLLIAAAAEWVQLFLPYRAYNINDLLGNALGVLIGALLVRFLPMRVSVVSMLL